MHWLRVALFVALLAIIRVQHHAYLARHQPGTSIALVEAQRLFPRGATLQEADDASFEVRDAAGNRLGRVLQSSPEGDRVIGFSGPTNVLIGFDTEERIVGIHVLSSRDTPEHVKQVASNPSFLRSFNDQTAFEAARRGKVDAVSGSTLTSLAMVEAVQRRLGGQPASLKFPSAITAAEARVVFPQADRVEADPGDPVVIRVINAKGESPGWLLRTSPAADNIIGYQGPTDALIGFDAQGKVVGIAVAKSFDNDPYVRYVREDESFRELFNGRTIAELAGMDLKKEEVEGVSGATMTSLAVARGIVSAAESKRVREANAASTMKTPRWLRVSGSDAGTVAVVALGLGIGLTRLRGVTWLRITFQVVVLAYLGAMNGAMLSQAQLVGWAQSGVPLSAVGLITLSAAALIVPVTTKRNVYCTHLCPHGALQQLTLRYAQPRLAGTWILRARYCSVLSVVPAALLVFTLLVALSHWPFNLVHIEPFDAYVFQVAGTATIVIAAAGAIASCFVPMAYCRYGCPTGALLDYLRRNAHSDRFTIRDAFAFACVAIAATVVVAGS